MTTTGFPTLGLSETGSLPTGVTFVDNGNGTATLAGTPAAGTSGVYPLTIGASNGVSPDASQSFTLTVDAAPSITSADAATFTRGVGRQLHGDDVGPAHARAERDGGSARRRHLHRQR